MLLLLWEHVQTILLDSESVDVPLERLIVELDIVAELLF